MRNLPQSLADLEFRESSIDQDFSFEKNSFKRVLNPHYKDKHFDQMQKKIAEEYHNLQEVSIEMGEAEDAFHKIMQVRQKLVDVYRDLVVKSQSNEIT